MRPDRETILARYEFPLDRFQLQAVDALDAGANVVVAAPTGSGKTVVAEYAIAAALANGRRAFYTAPIKALSNQKYRDLVAIHGDGQVGLLTGDNAINGDAPIVVMTTEVLRNMIYARRELDDLEVVVLDEVHFLQDAYRGPVWEEVIIHLPMHVRLVCLSATVSNAAELAEWIETVRGATEVVVEERRPVQLDNFYYVDRPDQRSPADAADDRRRPSQPRRTAPRCERRAFPSWTPRRSRSARERPAETGDPEPGRDRRRARRATVAPGDLLHLQPRPVRRGGAGLCRRRDASRRRRGALADQRDRYRASRRSLECRPGRAGPRPLHESTDGRLRPPPRRDGAALQGGRRGVLRGGVDQGRVRDRDARGGDQHAGAQRGDREADQVHR